MTPVENDFRSHVLWSTTESPRLATMAYFLGKPKVHLCVKVDQQFGIVRFINSM